MGKWSQYKRGFRVEWKDDVMLKDWLESIPGDDTNTRCRYCDVTIPAHYVGLCKHALTARHAKNSAVRSTVHHRTAADAAANISGSCALDSETKLSTRDMEMQCTLELSVYDVTSSNVDRASTTDSSANSITLGESAQVNTVPQVTHASCCTRPSDSIESAVCDPTSFDASGATLLEGNIDEPAGSELHKPCTSSRQQKLKKGSAVGKHARKFVARWTIDPLLCDWLVAASDGNSAGCSVCNCSLRAHYVDLINHSKSQKHIANFARRHNCDSAAETSTNDVNADDSQKSEAPTTGSFLLSHWGQYRQKYRKEWESDPLFKGWIGPVEGDVHKARCLYCRLLFRAHRKDLKNHALTSKHANNVAFGVPPGDRDEQLNTDQPLHSQLVSGRRNFGTKKRNRFDRQSAKPLGMSDQTHLHSADLKLDLLTPDDSLTTHDDLIAMATTPYGGQSQPSVLTTLIMPSSSTFDPTALKHLENVTAAPDDMQTLYRVKKLHPLAYKLNKAGSQPTTSTAAVVTTPSTASSSARDSSLGRLARTVTLWEFLNIRVDWSQRRSGSRSAARLAALLAEFDTLSRQLKAVAADQLVPVHESTEPPDTAALGQDIIVIQSADLAQFLGITVGKYYVRDPSDRPGSQSEQSVLKKTTRRGRLTTKLAAHLTTSGQIDDGSNCLEVVVAVDTVSGGTAGEEQYIDGVQIDAETEEQPASDEALRLLGLDCVLSMLMDNK